MLRCKSRLLFKLRTRAHQMELNLECHMEQNLSDRIRERAYEIWVANGSPEGEADQHWLTAEKEILATLAPAVPNPPAKRRTGRAVGKRLSARTN
jgi:Protein of unknown function (DUF2934)